MVVCSNETSHCRLPSGHCQNKFANWSKKTPTYSDPTASRLSKKTKSHNKKTSQIRGQSNPSSWGCPNHQSRDFSKNFPVSLPTASPGTAFFSNPPVSCMFLKSGCVGACDTMNGFIRKNANQWAVEVSKFEFDVWKEEDWKNDNLDLGSSRVSRIHSKTHTPPPRPSHPKKSIYRNPVDPREVSIKSRGPRFFCRQKIVVWWTGFKASAESPQQMAIRKDFWSDIPSETKWRCWSSIPKENCPHGFKYLLRR